MGGGEYSKGVRYLLVMARVDRLWLGKVDIWSESSRLFPIVPPLCYLWRSQLSKDLFENVVPVNEILTATDCLSSVTLPHRDYSSVIPLANPGAIEPAQNTLKETPTNVCRCAESRLAIHFHHQAGQRVIVAGKDFVEYGQSKGGIQGTVAEGAREIIGRDFLLFEKGVH